MDDEDYDQGKIQQAIATLPFISTRSLTSNAPSTPQTFGHGKTIIQAFLHSLTQFPI
jgi:hypothetical protein